MTQKRAKVLRCIQYRASTLLVLQYDQRNGIRLRKRIQT